MKRYVLIVAGGKGLRMGNGLPKQFVLLAGRPVLMRTLERFHQWDAGADLIVALPAEHRAYWDKLCESFDCRIPHRIVTGGETRFHSVRNGLTLMNKPGLAGVHDGVRPFVATEVIDTCFAEAERYGTAVPVVQMIDSLRETTADGLKNRPVDRNRYVSVQTPQVFWVDLLKEAYRQPYQPVFTDDASVVEAMGKDIRTVAGNRGNIKITSPFDLQLAEALFHISTQTHD